MLQSQAAISCTISIIPTLANLDSAVGTNLRQGSRVKGQEAGDNRQYFSPACPQPPFFNDMKTIQTSRY